jgi:hypothetical protein
VQKIINLIKKWRRKSLERRLAYFKLAHKHSTGFDASEYWDLIQEIQRRLDEL